MDFLTLDKILVLDNLNIVLDKKHFVRADGRGISPTQADNFAFWDKAMEKKEKMKKKSDW